MKRLLKYSLIFTVCIIPLSIVIGFSTNWSKKSIITSSGSSGVKPFIEDFSKKYLINHKNIDITVDAGGSGYGITQVAKGYTDIGNASKDPYSSVNDEKEGIKDKWEQERIKTVTVAWEAICLVYIPPKNIPYEKIKNGDFLNISKNNIKKLYQAFSGLAEGEYGNKQPTLGEFINPSYQEYKTELDKVNLIPYVRTGGSLTSGTAASFYEYSRFENPHDGLSEKTETAFKVGSYGEDWKIIQTDEANSRTWDMFFKNNIEGSVAYLSSGFIQKNLKLIEKNGYGIFGYEKDGTINSYSPENMEKGSYNWCRPLNLMTSLERDIGEIYFIEWLLSDELKENWHRMGAAVLNDKQKESMQIENDPLEWTSDIEMGLNYYGADYDAK